VSSPVLRRSGSLDFPAPSLTLRVAARVFEVFRRCHAGPVLLAKSRCRADPQVLAPLRSVQPFNPGRRTDLSAAFPPLHRPCRASTPTDVAVGFGGRESLLRHPVPSSWFRTTSMVSSARRSRACCVPLPVMRFAAFPASELPFRPVRDRLVRGSRGISRDAVFTPRRIPPYRSRSTSLWPLPPCRCFRPVSASQPGSVAGSWFRGFAMSGACPPTF